ncbi:SDR family NAD(P)-dependent oxidoreductase [Sphingomonas sp. RHCKR7]|uniref:SDR family NAD(P)-dependent oxidoreductase n=1 Tax=Sphingomonas folli TaxID=2862497 RepID=UPI001CA5B9FD|nr:SDR family NAD(P)-dependent oxidoreductase [Sphingomonas folli]MBW6526781.1 SDR family NAD(P)-dependent oxidoreductase [Sphingomonas folli]
MTDSDKAATPLGRILITGASAGLGAALARHYAAPGRALLLWARDPTRLETVAAECRRAGATAQIRSLDLADSEAALRALVAEDEAGDIDLAILAAGLGDVRTAGRRVEAAAAVVRLGLVNFVTPGAMAAELAERMAARGRGDIVLIGSAAAAYSLPFAAGYAGSKAGLARLADALRVAVAPRGVRVLLVEPGPFDSPGGRLVPAPGWLTRRPAWVASQIARADARGRVRLTLPWPFALLRWIDPLLPRWARDRLLRALAPD